MAVGENIQPQGGQHIEGDLEFSRNNVHGVAAGHAVNSKLIGQQINITMNISKEVIEELEDHKYRVKNYSGRISIIVQSIQQMVAIIEQLSVVVQELSAFKKAEAQDVEQFLTRLILIQDMFKDIKVKVKSRTPPEQHTTEFQEDLLIIVAEVDMRRNELNLQIQIFQLRILGKSNRSPASAEKSIESKQESVNQEKLGFQIMRYYGPGPLFIPPPNLVSLYPTFLSGPGPPPMDPTAYSRKRHRPIYACWSLRKRGKMRTSWKHHDKELLRICSKELRYEVAWQREVIETPDNRVMHKIHGIKSRRQRDAIYDLLRDENMELQKRHKRLAWVIAGLHFQEEKYGRFGFRKTETVAMLLVLRTQPLLYEGTSGTFGGPGGIRGGPPRGPIGPIPLLPPPRSPSPFSPRHPKSRNRRPRQQASPPRREHHVFQEDQQVGVQPSDAPPSRHGESLPSEFSNPSNAIIRRRSSPPLTWYHHDVIEASQRRRHSYLEDPQSSYAQGPVETSHRIRAHGVSRNLIPTARRITWYDPRHETIVSSSEHPNIPFDSPKGKGKYHARVSDYESSSEGGDDYRHHSAGPLDFSMEENHHNAAPRTTAGPPRHLPPRSEPPPHRHEVPMQPQPRVLRSPTPPLPHHQGAPIYVHPAIPNHRSSPVPLIPRPGWESARFAELDHEVPPPVVDPRSPNFQEDIRMMLNESRDRSMHYAQRARIQAHELNTRSPYHREDLNIRFDEAQDYARYHAEHPGLELREREYLRPELDYERRHRRRRQPSHNIRVQDRSSRYPHDPWIDLLEPDYMPPEYAFEHRRSRSPHVILQDQSDRYYEYPRYERSNREYLPPELAFEQRNSGREWSPQRMYLRERPREYVSRRSSRRMHSPSRHHRRVYDVAAPNDLRQSHTDRSSREHRRSRADSAPNEHIIQRMSSPPRELRVEPYEWVRRRHRSERITSPRRDIRLQRF